MSSHSPNVSAARPALCSPVVRDPIGGVVAGELLLGLALLVLTAGAVTLGYPLRATLPAGLLGLGLLALAGRGIKRSNQPMLLTLTRAKVQLVPLGRRKTPGVAGETIPLASVVAYKYWLRVLKYQAFAQYHLRLELADGRVLHLADQPRARPDAPPDAVHLDAVVGKLARWVPPGTQVRKLFYLTQAARVLLWASGAALVTAAALLWRGHPAGGLLLFPTVGYGGSYYLGRGVAKITEQMLKIPGRSPGRPGMSSPA